MASKLNTEIEYVDGEVTYDETRNFKDFTILGGDNDDTVMLNIIDRGDKDDPAYVNIVYDGGAGIDELEYKDQYNPGDVIHSVHLSADPSLLHAPDGTSNEIYLSGGHAKDEDADTPLKGLEIWTRDVEIFNLTANDDSADLSQATQGYTIYSGGGKDTITGSDYADVFDASGGKDVVNAGAGNDTVTAGTDNDTVDGEAGDDYIDGGSGEDLLKGGEGDDYIDGDSGSDSLNGGSENDTIIGGKGSDTIAGGSGDDVIFADKGSNIASGESGQDVLYGFVDLTDNDVTVLYGDAVDQGDGTFAVTDGAENEADVFVLGYASTSTTAIETTSWQDTFLEGGEDALLEAGAKAITKAFGVGWAEPVVSLGIDALINGVEGGSKVDGLNVISADEARIEVKDFDLWGDLAIISLDENADQVHTNGTSYVTGNAAITVEYNNNPFMKLYADNVNATVQAGAFEDSAAEIVLDTDELEQLVLNAGKNALVVSTDASGTLTIQSLTGRDMTSSASAEQIAEMTADLGENSGVMLIGDYGGSTIYAHDSDAAGTNSDDIIYSGSYQTDSINEFSSGSDINIYAGAGDDIVYGTAGTSDRLFGGSGDDYLHVMGASGASVDQIFGGTGTDIAAFSRIAGQNTGSEKLSHGIFVDFSDLKTELAEYGKEYVLVQNNDGQDLAFLYDTEGIDGSGADDIIIGNDEANVFAGNEGADSIDGAAGEDTILSGEGDDTLTGGTGSDLFVLDGDGNKTITDLELGDELLFAGASSSDEITISHDGSETTISFGSISVLIQNWLLVTDSFSIVYVEADGFAPAGLKLIYSTSGTAPYDTMQTGTSAGETFTGTDANDFIDAAGGGDGLFGLAGDDVLVGGSGADHIEGDSGNDTIYAGDGWNRIFGDRDDEGTDGDDVIYSGEGQDLIVGGGGTDTINFTRSAQNGLNIDLSAEHSASSHWFFRNNGEDYVKVAWNGGYSYFGGIENVVGSNGNDTITGNDDGNTLSGADGNDVITGGINANALYGGDGDDTLNAGDSGDHIEGGNGDDVIHGGAGWDRIYGDRDASGEDGDDYIYTGHGTDLILGGGGNDTVDFSTGDGTGLTIDMSDTSGSYWFFDAVDTSHFMVSWSGGSSRIGQVENITGSQGDDAITGDSEANVLDGADGADTLTGGAGDDVITGGAGNDTLDGGADDDVLTGGTGQDVFVFDLGATGARDASDVNTGNDTITDLDNSGNVFENEVIVFHADELTEEDFFLFSDFQGNLVIDVGTAQITVDGISFANDDYTLTSTGNFTFDGIDLDGQDSYMLWFG